MVFVAYDTCACVGTKWQRTNTVAVCHKLGALVVCYTCDAFEKFSIELQLGKRIRTSVGSVTTAPLLKWVQGEDFVY